MIAILTYVLLVTATIVVESAPSSLSSNKLKSPCPELFEIVENSDGLLKTSVTLVNDSELKGLWIRLIFDTPIKAATIDDKDFEAVIHENNTRDVLVKNRNFVLEANEAKILAIAFEYEGSKVPELQELRFNAKVRCLANNKNFVFAQPDAAISDQDLGIFEAVYNRTRFDSNSLTQNCGRAKLNPKKTGGIDAGQIPWLVSIYSVLNDKETFLCEATLISESALITSAHCLAWENTNKPIGKEYFKVYLPQSKDTSYSVQEVVIHPGYRADRLSDDIGLLKLAKPVKLNENVSPICLPSDETSKTAAPGGSLSADDILVVGFGFKENRKPTEKIEIAKLLIRTEIECKRKDSALVLLDNELCATYDQDHEVCVGSSGSGVFSAPDDSNPLWQLRGVVSLGRLVQQKFSCNPDSVVLISHVDNYLKWIRSSLA